MRILLTGAAGIVGRAIREPLENLGYELRLTDIQPQDPEQETEAFLQGDIQDPEFLSRALEGVDGVIHLAGLVGPDFTFEEVMGANVDGTYQLFEAAAQNGITQFIYASSHHAVGFLPRGTPIDASTPPRADSFYGISKAFGEVLASYYADRYGMNVLSVRIGYVGDTVVDERRVHTWCSSRDLAQLIDLGLKKRAPGYRVVYGVSKTPDPFFDNSAAAELGYQPQDCSLDFLEEPALAEVQPDPQDSDTWFVGGHFASAGLEQPLSRFLREHGIAESDSFPHPDKDK